MTEEAKIAATAAEVQIKVANDEITRLKKMIGPVFV
jgi:hypothetical protein